MKEVNNEKELVGGTLTRRDYLLRDADALVDRYEEEFSGTFLDGLFSMMRQLIQEVKELDAEVGSTTT